MNISNNQKQREKVDFVLKERSNFFPEYFSLFQSVFLVDAPEFLNKKIQWKRLSRKCYLA